MKVSDLIENVLKELIEETNGEAKFQRNELASRLNCVPSQINYVINSRFTNDHGYIVESHRGGGGSITIRRIHTDKASYIMHIVASMGKTLSQQSAFAFIRNFLDYGARGGFKQRFKTAWAAGAGFFARIGYEKHDGKFSLIRRHEV